jgi:hypothetical protein
MEFLFLVGFILFDLIFKITISLQEASNFFGKPYLSNKKFWTKIPVWFPKDFWHWMKNLSLYGLRLSMVCCVLSFIYFDWIVTCLYGLIMLVAGYMNPHRWMLLYWRDRK